MTDTPSSAKVSHVSIFLMRPENSSASKQLTNCAPLLLYESSAIMRCSTIFMRYPSAIIQRISRRLLCAARYGTESIPAPTPWPTMMLVASKKLSRDSPWILLIFKTHFLCFICIKSFGKSFPASAIMRKANIVSVTFPLRMTAQGSFTAAPPRAASLRRRTRLFVMTRRT